MGARFQCRAQIFACLLLQEAISFSASARFVAASYPFETWLLFSPCESKAWRDRNSLATAQPRDTSTKRSRAAFTLLCTKGKSVILETQVQSLSQTGRQSSVCRITSPSCHSGAHGALRAPAVRRRLVNKEWSGVCECFRCAVGTQVSSSREDHLGQAGSALGEAVPAMPWDLALPPSLDASCSCPFPFIALHKSSLLQVNLADDFRQKSALWIVSSTRCWWWHIWFPAASVPKSLESVKSSEGRS